MDLHPILRDKLEAGLLLAPTDDITRRDTRLPKMPNKVHAVIGMRRVGKTTFLRQLQSEWQRHGGPESAVYVSFDDDRLADLPVAQLNVLNEEYYRLFPHLRGNRVLTWLFDEIQWVTGWERFIRRLMDTERVSVVVSGSSAKLLSRQVHTSLRGRGWETVIRPFNFREVLRHRGEEPATPAPRFSPAERSAVEKRFLEYLVEGGFPEAQGLDSALRDELIQGYVSTLLLRDIIERHGVTQATALRWLARHALRSPASPLSVHALHRDLKAQGLAVGKDTVHALLDHLVDAFLLAAVPLATDSERRRNSNPRKLYPADPAFIRAFDRSGRSHVGHALETVVWSALARRRAEVGYVKTKEGWEVDFHVRLPSREELLIQVCAGPGEPTVWERELRALESAAHEFPRAERLLLVLTRDQLLSLPETETRVVPAYEWLLEWEAEG